MHTTTKKTATIGDVIIGDEYPTAFMAEVGTFFDRDIDRAIYLIDKAIDAGSDIIKSEILHDSDIILEKSNLDHTFNHATGAKTVNYRQLIEEKTVPLSHYKLIANHIASRGKPFVASVYDMAGVDFMVQNKGAGVKLWKNNYNNFPLIKYAAKSGLPIIFDMAFTPIHEVATAVNYAREFGATDIVVNHHPGLTPTPATKHQLSMIPYYKKLLGVPVGLACHYVGELMLYTAIGCGLNLIEKGVYDDVSKPEQGVMIATSLDGLPEVIQNVKNCYAALGSPPLQIPKERDRTLEYGLTSKTEVTKGEPLTLSNVRFSFPAKGIPARYWPIIEGNLMKQDLEKGNPIKWVDIDFILNNQA